jgi:hypothetical protein
MNPIATSLAAQRNVACDIEGADGAALRMLFASS